MKHESICAINNCRGRAPADDIFCAKHSVRGGDDEGTEYIPNQMRNYATICEDRGLLVEAAGLRDMADILSPILARNAQQGSTFGSQANGGI